MKGIKLLLPIVLAASLSIATTTTRAAQQPQQQQTSATIQSQLEALEKRFFIHDFQRDTVEQRLARMEKFTFGETHLGAPEARIAKIAGTLESHSASQKLSDIMDLGSHVAVKKSNELDAPAGNSSRSSSKEEDDSTTDYPHVTYLEDELLGQDFPGQSLESRLQRLETKAFGAPSKSNDFVDRTDALERYAETRLHKKAFVERPEDDAGTIARKPISLPPNIAAGINGLFDSHNKINFHEAHAPTLNEDSVDPEMTKTTPPPANARLLTRVAWCEIHTFGRTFPDLHLLPRLHQLNSKLFPNDKEKDFELMDHFDSIMKEVVLRQHPAPGA